MDIQRAFLSFDFISESFSFEENGSKSFKNTFGAILSIVIIIFSFIISSLFGKEIFQRKIPITSGYNSYVKNSNFTLKEFPIFFEIMKTDGSKISNWDQYFDIKAYKLNYTNSLIDQFTVFDYSVKLCKLEDFDKIKSYLDEESISNIINNPIICIYYDDESVVLNDYGYLNSSFIDIEFNYKNPNDYTNVAKDYLELKDDFYVNTLFLNNYIDSFNYEHPIKYYLDSFSVQVSSSFLKRAYFKFTNDKFISDNGWMLEDINQHELIVYKGNNVEINAKSQLYPNALYWVTLSSPKIAHVTYRQYIKIQELSAKIGGIVSSITIFIQILFSSYLRFNYFMQVSRHFIEAEITKYDKKSYTINLFNSKIETKNKDSIYFKDNFQNKLEDISKLNLNKNVSSSNILPKKIDRDNKLSKEDGLDKEEKNINIKIRDNERNNSSFENDNKKNYLIDIKSYTENYSYFYSLLEELKSFFTCCSSKCQPDEKYLAVKKYFYFHLSFFRNVKRLVYFSSLINEEED